MVSPLNKKQKEGAVNHLTAHKEEYSRIGGDLYLMFALGNTEWKLGFTAGLVRSLAIRRFQGEIRPVLRQRSIGQWRLYTGAFGIEPSLVDESFYTDAKIAFSQSVKLELIYMIPQFRNSGGRVHGEEG